MHSVMARALAGSRRTDVDCTVHNHTELFRDGTEIDSFSSGCAHVNLESSSKAIINNQQQQPKFNMIDQTMSLYLPRVFGPDDEQIKREISEQMAEQGIGVTSRVDVDHHPKGHKQAFVHFSEWLETEENEQLQADVRSGEAPRISNGRIGYWILKLNTSADKGSPNPRPAVDQETVMLQAKTIRDLRRQLEETKGWASESAASLADLSQKFKDLRTENAEHKRELVRARQRLGRPVETKSAQARAWAKEREAKREAEEEQPSLYELDEGVRRIWRLPSRSQPGVFRTVKWMYDGSWECDCPATKECWHIKQCKLEVAGELEAGEGDSTPQVRQLVTQRNFAEVQKEQCVKRCVQLLGQLRAAEVERDQARRERDEARSDLEDSQDRNAMLKALAQLPPQPPLKRSRPLVGGLEEYEAMRAQWEREGIEGCDGRVPALDRFRGSALVRRKNTGAVSPDDLTAERMAAQSQAFSEAVKDGSVESPDWSEQGLPRNLLVDERGGTLTASVASEVESELRAWRESKDCNGGLGPGAEA